MRATAGVTVDLGVANPYATEGATNDLLSSMEAVQGSPFADILRGDAARNRLFGGRGRDTLLGLSRARVTLEEDPARMRPSDIPTVLGDRSRIAAEIGWQPEVPIERTLADLLDYWRKATPRPAAGRP